MSLAIYNSWKNLDVDFQYQRATSSCMGLLPDTQNCRMRLRRECWEHFPPPPTLKETASLRSRHASRHVRHARAVMHVGIAHKRWRGKRSRCIRTRNFTYLARDRLSTVLKRSGITFTVYELIIEILRKLLFSNFDTNIPIRSPTCTCHGICKLTICLDRCFTFKKNPHFFRIRIVHPEAPCCVPP